MTQQTLQLHPDFNCRPAGAIQVEARRGAASTLRLVYSVTGDINLLKLPPAVSPDRTDNLWKTTCFEAFIRPGDAPDYLEFNFSPSSAWAAYGFTGEREGMHDLDLPAVPRISTTRTAQGYQLEVLLDLPAAAFPADRDWRVGLTAVIEDMDGAVSFWALAHATPPNFHDRDTWVCDLKASEQA
jgi:hypothetical protein